MSDDVIAGAPVVYPGRVAGVGPLHLGRTEARKGREPAVIGICPIADGVELERGIEPPRRHWWQLRRRARLQWCPYCQALRERLFEIARKQGAL